MEEGVEPIARQFCGLRLYYYPNVGEYYIGHWRFGVWKVVTFPVFLYMIWWYQRVMVFPCLQEARMVEMISIVGILLITIAHFMITIEGPGYLPFNYKYGQRNGCPLALTRAHLEIALDNKLRERTVFVQSCRRFVISLSCYDSIGDCCIGKRNGKLFFWRSVYVCLFLAYFGFTTADSLYGVVSDYMIGTAAMANVLMTIIALSLSAVNAVIAIGFLNGVLLDKWANPALCDRVYASESTTFDNFKKVFGDNPWTWLLPISAFIGISDEELYEKSSDRPIYIL